MRNVRIFKIVYTILKMLMISTQRHLVRGDQASPPVEVITKERQQVQLQYLAKLYQSRDGHAVFTDLVLLHLRVRKAHEFAKL